MANVVYKHFRRMMLLWLLTLLCIGIGSLVDAQDTLTATTISSLNLRIGPSTKQEVITKLPRKTQVVIEGRNNIGDWLLVHTMDNSVRGWVATRYLILPDNFNLAGQPVTDEILAPKDPNQPPVAYGDALPATNDLDQLEAALQALPVLPDITHHVYTIYANGQQLGNRVHVFAKVGDSLTAVEPFLWGFGTGQYNLGAYGYLQATIDFFNTPLNNKGETSFNIANMSAQSGFTSGAVLDATWSDPRQCPNQLSPLQCEFALIRPSVAIIMFGSEDMQISDIATFEYYMQQIVQQTIDKGVIPVLNTFPGNHNFRWEESLKFNTVIVNIARKYDVPVINLWRATQPLPNWGTGDDNFHLSHDSDHIFAFDGSEKRYGLTLRNLLTLQMLDVLRQQVLR
jgi:hypothetical protein